MDILQHIILQRDPQRIQANIFSSKPFLIISRNMSMGIANRKSLLIYSQNLEHYILVYIFSNQCQQKREYSSLHISYFKSMRNKAKDNIFNMILQFKVRVIIHINPHMTLQSFMHKKKEDKIEHIYDRLHYRREKSSFQNNVLCIYESNYLQNTIQNTFIRNIQFHHPHKFLRGIIMCIVQSSYLHNKCLGMRKISRYFARGMFGLDYSHSFLLDIYQRKLQFLLRCLSSKKVSLRNNGRRKKTYHYLKIDHWNRSLNIIWNPIYQRSNHQDKAERTNI